VVEIQTATVYNNIEFIGFSPRGGEKMSVKRAIQLSLVIVLLFASFALTSSVHANAYCPARYVVQPGDWLAKIARNCGVTLSQMYAANPGVGYYIYPGQVLNIPGGYYNPGYYCGPSYSAYYGNYYISISTRNIFSKNTSLASKRISLPRHLFNAPG
jgi:hypothetical protein